VVLKESKKNLCGIGASQMLTLELKAVKLQYISHIPKQLIILGLDSSNTFLRYIHIYSGEKVNALVGLSQEREMILGYPCRKGVVVE
jgi:hypothetical protein